MLYVFGHGGKRCNGWKLAATDGGGNGWRLAATDGGWLKRMARATDGGGLQRLAVDCNGGRGHKHETPAQNA